MMQWGYRNTPICQHGDCWHCHWLFWLGLLSAVASACCTLPAMGMLVAYSGTREDANRKTAFASAIAFMIGTTLALIVLGFVAGFVGQTAQALLGRYWKLLAGVIAVVFDGRTQNYTVETAGNLFGRQKRDPPDRGF